MEIRNKIGIVTGAASGIGHAVSVELAKRQIGRLAMVDRSAEVGELARTLNQACGREVAEAYVGDVAAEDFRAAVYHTIRERHGTVNICVPAAGLTRDSLAVRIDKQSGKVIVYPTELFRLVTEINLIAPIYWALELVAGVAGERKRTGKARWEPAEGLQGTVIFIGSVSSLGNKGQIAYAASKAGLEGAAATLMMEAIFHGVRCAVIHPGYTDTPMVRALGEAYVKEHIIPQTQLRRLMQPEEVADAICFMISNDAVSGSLWADAGWHPRA